jgi:hypothetical protein
MRRMAEVPDVEASSSWTPSRLRRGHAGNAMVDHTPVGKSTKDKEPAEAHEDGAAA